MAIVIKSNSVALKSISSSLYMSLPTDPVLHLDFAGGVYKFKGETTGLSDVVGTNRNGPAGYVTENGDYHLASVNEPRVHYESGVGKGLLGVSSITNLADNPNAPQTQTIIVSIPSNRWLVVQASGTGSCQVEVSGSSGVVDTGTATESKAYVFSPQATISNATVTLTPSSLNHLQCFLSDAPTAIAHKFGAKGEIKQRDFNYIQNDKVSSIVSENNEFSIVLRRADLNALDLMSALGATTVGVMQVIETSASNGFFVANFVNWRNNSSGLRVNGNNEASAITTATSGHDTYALSYKAGEAKLFHNGVVVSLDYGRAVDIGRVFLGSGVTWDTQQPHLITEAYAYSRALSDDELMGLYY